MASKSAIVKPRRARYNKVQFLEGNLPSRGNKEWAATFARVKALFVAMPPTSPPCFPEWVYTSPGQISVPWNSPCVPKNTSNTLYLLCVMYGMRFPTEKLLEWVQGESFFGIAAVHFPSKAHREAFTSPLGADEAGKLCLLDDLLYKSKEFKTVQKRWQTARFREFVGSGGAVYVRYDRTLFERVRKTGQRKKSTVQEDAVSTSPPPSQNVLPPIALLLRCMDPI